MDKRILAVLACPQCHGELVYSKDDQQLCCNLDKLIFPIIDGIPMLCIDQAEQKSDFV